jgi:hypothetical protein
MFMQDVQAIDRWDIPRNVLCTTPFHGHIKGFIIVFIFYSWEIKSSVVNQKFSTSNFFITSSQPGGGVCYQCKNSVCSSKILNFYSTFFNVKTNSIFTEILEQKKNTVFRKTSLKKHC